MGATPTPPHVLVFPFPTVGHMNPMFHLSTLLASRGFTVTFVLSEYNYAKRNYPSDGHMNTNIRFLQLPDGLPPQHPRTSDIPLLCHSVTHAMPFALEQHLMNERQMVGEPPITCIINDCMVLHIQQIATKFSIPYAVFWTQSAASYTSMLLVQRGYRPPPDPSARISCIPGVPPFKQTEINTFLQSYDASDFMFYFLTQPLEGINEADWVLVNTFYELEPETIDFLMHDYELNIGAIGPLLPPAFFSRPQDSSSSQDIAPCLKWLDMHPPSSVVYVAFGSLAVLSEEEFEEICMGLEGSRQCFIFAVREGMVCGDGWREMMEGCKRRVGERGLFEYGWAPQLEVLKHPSIAAFLTHCGWNSTLEAMAAGVPMIGMGCFSDQPMNCRCVEDGWKVGVKLERRNEGRVGREEVEKKVREVMRGGEMRKRVEECRERGGRAVCEGGSSEVAIQRFVNHILSLSLNQIKGAAPHHNQSSYRGNNLGSPHDPQAQNDPPPCMKSP